MKVKTNHVLWLMICILLISGCSVQFVSKYDEQTMNELSTLDFRIETLYRQMLAISEDQRLYDHYASDYIGIQVAISSCQRYQSRRKNNQETQKQITILMNLWQQDMQTHKTKNTLSDFLVKRRINQYRRLIDTIMDGEIAKKQD